MNAPKRMSIFASADRIRVQWLSLTVIVDALFGLVNMIGPADNATQRLLRDVAPIWSWYGLFLLAAAAIGFGYSKTGAAVGMFGWLFLALAACLSIGNGTALSWGGPVLYALPMGQHFLIILEVG